MKLIYCVPPGSAYMVLSARVDEGLRIVGHLLLTGRYGKPSVKVYPPGQLVDPDDLDNEEGNGCKAHVRLVLEIPPAPVVEACS